MVSSLDLLEEQMRISRGEEGIDILERCFRGISNPSEISESVRDFYLQFALKAEQSKNAEIAWTELLGSGCAEYVSYYRIDSYLLADAPFTLRSPIFFLSTSTTTLENGTYYGVKADGLKLLIENFLAWPVADDIQNYPDVIKNFIEGLNKNPPLYAHCFEVSLATYWLKNIKSSLDANSKQIAEKFQKGEATYLDFLLNVYYPYKTKQVKNLKQVIESISAEPSGGAPPLNYSDLRETTKEMLMRVSLFSEVLSDLTSQGIEWVQLDKVLEDLEDIMKNQQLNDEQRKRKVSEYVYKFWQIYGTPWSYSRGGTTDFSLRDLSPSGLREAQPQETEKSFKIPTFSRFKRIVKKTNIDDANNRGKQTKERKELLEGLVNAAKKEIEQYGAPWMLISYIGPLARAYEEQDQQKIDEVKGGITELLKGARRYGIRKATAKFISGVAIHLTIKPIIHSFLHLISEEAPTLGTAVLSIVLVGESGHLLNQLVGYRITRLGNYYYSHIFSDQVQLQRISESPRFRIAIVNLPYQRKGSQFSGRSLYAIGYGTLP